MTYCPSEYKDDSIAFWLVAYVHQLDTHALWSAKVFSGRNTDKIETSEWFFRDYFSSSEVLHEFVKRGLVTRIEKQVTKHIMAGAWEELEETLSACRPYLTIPLNKEAEEHLDKYSEPNRKYWFEIIVEAFSEDIVRFSLSMWGYKYSLQNLVLGKQLYYLFADRLEAQIRFVDNWFPLESLSQQLHPLIVQSLLLIPVKNDLKHELSLLKNPTDSQIRSSCRSLFPLLERTLREYSSSKDWSGKSRNLDALIGQFDNANVFSQDTIELFRFIAKPKRDYIQHGGEIPIPIAKIVLATLLELFVRMVKELDAAISVPK